MKSKRRYAQDYESTPRLDGAKGKLKYDVKYKGKFYKLGLSDEALKKAKLIAALLSALYAVCFVVAGVANSAGTRQLFVVLPYVCQFLPAAMLVYDAVKLYTTPKRMTLKQYDASVAEYRNMTLFYAIASAACLIGEVIFLVFTQGGYEVWREVLFAGSVAIGFTASVISYICQKKINIVTEDAPKGGVDSKDL